MICDEKDSNPLCYSYKVNSYISTADASCPLVPWWDGWLSQKGKLTDHEDIAGCSFFTRAIIQYQVLRGIFGHCY